ncbi:MAG: prepilin-type N-terminal cleavage/methylation domain-containing protein [Chthonomonadaceae bacterium]|jgi:prepilin-type N-terminal cleavage/methylation domain-containing protein|nr:prepilin-type N-terminal cleavage/methylation domain-containing protein [Chthonomonadaceae bacterium]
MRKHKGFTLVEIMIVVLIIGILLAIAVPNFITARMKSRLQTVVANLREVDDAKEHCAMVNQLAVGDSCADYTPYLKTYPPKFPVAGPLVEGPVGTYATFKGKNSSQWMADPTGL